MPITALSIKAFNISLSPLCSRRLLRVEMAEIMPSQAANHLKGSLWIAGKVSNFVTFVSGCRASNRWRALPPNTRSTPSESPLPPPLERATSAGWQGS
jgi:hypothetical protein